MKDIETQVAAAEKEIEAMLAADAAASKSVADASKPAANDETLKTLVESVATLTKSVAEIKDQRSASRSEDGDDDEDDDDDDDEGENLDARKSFMRKSLADLDPADGTRDPGKAAMEVSRWLDGAMGVIKAQDKEIRSLKKSLGTALSEVQRQVGLLVQLAAVQAKKSLAADETRRETPRGRTSQLDVLAPSAGKPADDPTAAATVEARTIPVRLKNLALKAMKAGAISPTDVALVESYVNGSGAIGMEYGGHGPSLPPEGLLRTIMQFDDKPVAA